MNHAPRRRWKRTSGTVALVLIAALTSMADGWGQAKRPRWVGRSGAPVNAGSHSRSEAASRPPVAESAQVRPRRSSQVDQDQGEVVELSAHLVVVPVSVTDASGEPILNLTANDFVLEEDGRRQKIITLGAPGATPVEMSLLFDVSGSIFNRFQFAQQSALRFIQEILKPGDAISIFSIGPTPKMAQPRTRSSEEAVAGLMAIEPTRGATAFFDTLVEAAHDLDGRGADSHTRRVMIAISDGEDNYSHQNNLARSLQELQRTDCLFYAINPSGPAIRLNKISLKGQQGMEMLATQTGGAVFLLQSLDHLEQAFRQIAAELQAQYLLGYYSSSEIADGRFRRISVHIVNHPQFRIRARQGYYALKS